MNCETARERLVDLVYGELDDADRRAVEAHAASCAACGSALAKLRAARALLARGRRGEPAAAPALPAEVSRGGAAWLRRLFGRRPLAVALAAAAAVVIAIVLWPTVVEPPRTIAGEVGPAEIKRVGVSLTILSEPEGWPGRFDWSGQRQMAVQQRVNNAPAGQNWQVGSQTIGQMDAQWNDRIWYRGWPGLALVRDRRMVRRLKKGSTSVRLAGVPSGILANSVRLRSLDDANALAVLEQNYQYDLASAAAVLKRYVDKPVTVVFQGGGQAAGRLLSFDGQTLVIQPPNQGPRNIDRSQVAAVTFDKLPEGLRTQPTLVWDLHNRGAARQRFEVAYLTYGLNWRADYVLKLRLAAGKPQRVKGARGEIPAIFDTADIVGYATVANQSGVTYEDAQLKLLAGDVNLIVPRPRVTTYALAQNGDNDQAGAVPQFQEKSFFEYHLYTLTRPTTLKAAETKQLEFLTASGVPMTRGYIYDPHRGHKTAVRVVSEFKNSEDNHLGKPLPKGLLRLYAPDADGVQEYVAQQSIDHTPVNEKVRVLWGYAFDLVGAFKQTDYRRSGSARHYKWEYRLRNHKDYDVTVTIVAHVNKATYQAECSHPWHVRAVGVVEIEVPVRANSAAKITFSHSYNYRSGGGLTSPFDKKAE